jgi:D-sedoheptulose 7-phosphate isomerase
MSVKSHFEEASNLLRDFLAEDSNFKRIEEAVDMIAAAMKNDKKVISCGNGGSMSDAMHFAEELSGRYRDDRPGLAAISISDPSHITCVGNDYGFDKIFSRFVEAVGKTGDVLLAISTSGNSANVIEAAKSAKQQGMHVIGLTGKDGGVLAPLCDVEIRVPWNGYADRIQEVHIKVIHSMIDAIEKATA